MRAHLKIFNGYSSVFPSLCASSRINSFLYFGDTSAYLRGDIIESVVRQMGFMLRVLSSILTQSADIAGALSQNDILVSLKPVIFLYGIFPRIKSPILISSPSSLNV